jgi:hypothetical protein
MERNRGKGIAMMEEQIVKWMREKVKRDGFTDAASLAREFLDSHKITNVLDPEFSRTMDAGFRIAKEVYSL